jgi:hypothetical protein
MRAIRRPIVDVNFSREPSFAQSLDETIGQVFEVLLEVELPMGNKTGMIVQEGKEKTLSDLPIDNHRRAMHTVRLPQIIGQFGLIPSEIRFEPLRFVQSPALKEPVQALNGSPKVGRQKLSFPGHPEDHGQGGSFEFGL